VENGFDGTLSGRFSASRTRHGILHLHHATKTAAAQANSHRIDRFLILASTPSLERRIMFSARMLIVATTAKDLAWRLQTGQNYLVDCSPWSESSRLTRVGLAFQNLLSVSPDLTKEEMHEYAAADYLSQHAALGCYRSKRA
jgi:hypothetical protein